MMLALLVAAALTGPVTVAAVAAPDASLAAPLAELATRALAGDARAADGLRAAGPAGLAALLARKPAGDAARAVVDRVAAQHDATSSGLYWYTELAAARAEAARTGRPILSLRLLGRLDEELSCANSRFFRGLLYADPSVARVLRERFVLHWQMVRPVPVVTVDMGDGRSFKTTITGNSAHLVLDAAGAPVDAIPGMYGPQAFLAALDGALVAAACTSRACLAKTHAKAIEALDAAWAHDLRALGRDEERVAATVKADDERAGAIADRAMAKGIVELPLLRKLDTNVIHKEPALLREVGWLHRAATKWDAGALARFVGGRSPSFGARLLREISADTAQNEQMHHRAIHEWFVRGDAVTRGEAELTRALYDTVFATPSTDPWLGLSDVRDGAVVR